jgi:riboflavin synthase
MFTGLIQELGTVQAVKKVGPGIRLTVKCSAVAKDAAVGDSIAVNGCCLTVVKKSRQSLSFDAGSETLSRTNMSRLKAGDAVNLERSMQLGERLGGHLVTGHIDGVATVVKHREEGDWTHVTFRTLARLMRHIASKGSVAIDGVSLTIVGVELDRFSVALIPHTLENTTLGTLQVGTVVNVETDLVAKYVERLIETRRPDERSLSAFA